MLNKIDFGIISTVENGNPLNKFSVTEGLLPALNISKEDMLMEWPAERSGWAIPHDQLKAETGFSRSVISFSADVYLCEICLLVLCLFSTHAIRHT